MKLYFAPDTAARACRIALAEAGAACEMVRIDIPAGEQRSAKYLALNPKGRVPTLVTERGILTETPAILAFIAQSFPAARLAPIDDPFAFAEVQAFNAYLCSTVHVAHAHGYRGNRWADDAAAIAEMKRKAPEVVLAAYELIEHGMLKGPWVTGADYTIADAYLFTLANWIDEDAVDMRRLPRIREHRARVGERPAVRAVVADES